MPKNNANPTNLKLGSTTLPSCIELYRKGPKRLINPPTHSPKRGEIIPMLSKLNIGNSLTVSQNPAKYKIEPSAGSPQII
jgi:hypothetical protein